MASGQPKITVAIPVYNSASTLSRAVTSVSRQTQPDFELLIVDDGSNDGSAMLAQELARSDSRINVISLPENHGKSYALNRAIAVARGTWIAVLDADDWYEPARLATLIAVGEACDVSLVADNQRFHDAATGGEAGLAFPDGGGTISLTRDLFIGGCDPYAAFNFGMLKPIVRTEFIRASGLAYRENARLSEDFLYLVEFFAHGGRGLLLSQPFYNWTLPFSSVTRQWTTTGAGAWRYDFQAAIDANEDVLRVLRERDESALAMLMARRIRAFRRLHQLREISRSRAMGVGLPRIAIAVAAHPSIWPRLAIRAWQRARRLLSVCVGGDSTTAFVAASSMPSVTLRKLNART
jgi:succinoglycan biosynthesis protein ExoO